MNAAREQTERAADRIRAELISTLKELDRRRHLALDLRYQAEKHFTLLVAVATGAATAVCVGMAVSVVRSRARRNHRFQERVRGFLRAWENPHRIARSLPHRAIAVEIGRALTRALVATLAIALAKRSARRILPGNSSQPQLSPDEGFH